CNAAKPVGTGLLATTMISDFEGMAPGAVTAVTPPGGWFSYKDATVGNMLTPDNSAFMNFMADTPGANGTMHSIHVVGSGFMPPASGTSYGGGVGVALAGDVPTDLSMYSGITFWAKSGATPSEMSVAVSTTATDPKFCECLLQGCYSSYAFLIGTAKG